MAHDSDLWVFPGGTFDGASLAVGRPAARRAEAGAGASSAPAGSAQRHPATHVTLVLLPPRSSVEQLGNVGGMAPGLLSAGLGGVSAAQTYLDIGQGNRVFDSLYDAELSPLRVAVNRVREWSGVLARAESAPAEISPGLLGSSLRRAGVLVTASPSLGEAATLAVDEAGQIPSAVVSDRRGDMGAPPPLPRGEVGGAPGLAVQVRGLSGAASSALKFGARRLLPCQGWSRSCAETTS